MRLPSARNKRVVQTIVVIALIATAGVAAYVAYQQYTCSLSIAGCGPPVYPSIQSASAHVNSTSLNSFTKDCPTVMMDYITNSAVCSLWMNGGDSGTVTLNVHNVNQQRTQTGGNLVQFMAYSSEPQYVNFTSMPTCGYTTAPTWNATTCTVLGWWTQPFQFSFKVSPSYGVSNFREPASITITMYQTCCFP